MDWLFYQFVRVAPFIGILIHIFPKDNITKFSVPLQWGVGFSERTTSLCDWLGKPVDSLSSCVNSNSEIIISDCGVRNKCPIDSGGGKECEGRVCGGRCVRYGWWREECWRGDGGREFEGGVVEGRMVEGGVMANHLLAMLRTSA